MVLKLPVIFVFENNGYGEATGVNYAVGSGDITARTAAFGMPAHKIDGADFFAVHECAGEAITRARDGGGPSAIEAVITRYGGHFVGDPQLYRAKDEVARMRRELDCLKIFRARMKKTGWLSDAELNEIDGEVATLIEEAVAEGMAAPHPKPADLYADVYNAY